MPLFRGTRYPLMGGRGISYILRDEFDDTRAAGAVNGTPATPGPGTRTVTDGNSKLSLASGVASFATGGVGGSNPGMWYTAVSRRAGLILRAQITATTARISTGFDDGTSGGLADCTLLFRAATSVLVFSGPEVTIGSFSPGTSYAVAIVCRAAGGFLFIKGGTFTNWTLLWTNSVLASATIYAALVAGDTTTVATSDYLRIPAQLWVPTPLASDSFDGANGTMHGRLTDGLAVEEAGGSGKVWTATTWTIASNVAVNTPTLGADVIVDGAMTDTANWDEGAGWSIGAGVASIAGAATADLTAHVAPLTANTWYTVTWTNSSMAAGTIGPKLGTGAWKAYSTDGAKTTTGVANTTAFAMAGAAATGSIDNVTCKAITMANLFASIPVGVADVLVELPITDTGSNAAGYQVGVVVNLDSAASPANFIIAYLTGNATLNVDEWVAGVRTNKIAAAVTYAAAAKIKIIRSSTSLWCFYNEAAVGTVQTMTANTGTIHGMFSTYATPTVNNLAIFARGTGGEWEALSAF